MSSPTQLELQRQRVAALAYSLSTSAVPVEIIETHISWVLLIGEYAYKLKKAVNLGFLDYTTLESRRHFCQEELRLNCRTAPDLYLEVVAITGDCDHPVINGKGKATEWAVKMRRFDQQQLASHLADHDRLTAQQMDRLAGAIAGFHRTISTADPASNLGAAENVRHPVEENFRHIGRLIQEPQILALLEQLRAWYRTAFTSLTPVMQQRKREGFIRECHGDLHLGNIVMVNDEPLPFDGIEFNDNLRYIDVISEIAFLIMDLDHRGRSDLGWRFLDGYLQESGDYAGLVLLRFYQVYRAMVRAKVAAIRTGQVEIDDGERHALLAEIKSYLQLALGYTRPAAPQLILTHGFSGSGKTSVTQHLLEQWGAVRIRSDIERKRLFGLGATQASASQVAEGIYTADASAKTYARLAQLCGILLDAAFNVIVDATFLHRKDRENFIRLAESRDIHWCLLDVCASQPVMRERIVARRAGHGDASEADLAVLEYQLRHHDPLSSDELHHRVTINTGTPWTVAALLTRLRAVKEPLN